MKPTLLFTSFTHGTADAMPCRRSAFPRIEQSYKAPALPKFGGGCACPEIPSFRNISCEYFRHEARGEFRRELIAFGAIFVTAAIPILSNVHALADFLRAIGKL